MILTERDFQFLEFVGEHYTATAEQVRDNLCPDKPDTVVIRRRFRLMKEAGLVNIARAEVLTLNNDVHCQVYYPSARGMRELALHTGAMRWLLTPTKAPYTQHLAHFVALTDLRILIKKAIAAQSAFCLGEYYNQFDTTNPDAEDPREHYKLYTQVQSEPRQIACVPDAAFDLRVTGTSGSTLCKAFYVELERGTTTPKKAAAKKSPGYNGLAQRQLHRCHFPGSLEQFSVLVFAPHAGWRDELRREFSKKASPQLYKFAAMPEATIQTLLFCPVWYPCVGDPQPLLKMPSTVPGAMPEGAHPVTTEGR